jgi:hypothetical protein
MQAGWSAADVAIAVAIAAAFLVAAYLYRSLPQILNALALRRAELSPRARAARLAKLREEQASYRSALGDPAAYQAQAQHLGVLVVVSGIMTVLMVALFAASQLLRLRWQDANPVAFATIDILLCLFALSSLIGFRLAVFRSWMFLHPKRNLGRLERGVARLEGK